MKRRTKRFDDGGSVDIPETGTGLQKETFKEAYRRNRNRGEKTFTWNGKKFSTESVEEKAAREAAALAKKPDESTAETARLRRQVDTAQKSEPAPAPAPKQVDEAPKKRRELPDPKYTKEVNDALTMALQGGILSKEIPKALRHLRTPKDVTERIEPTFKKGGKVSSASSRGDGIAQRGKTKGRMC